MNKKIFTFFSVFLILLFFSYSQTKQVKIVAEKANVYLEASAHSYLIETLEKGTILNIYGSGKVTNIGVDWYNVYYKSKKMGSVVTGFIEASKVELLEPPKSIEAEQEKPVEETVVKKPAEEIKTIEKKAQTAKVEKVELAKEKVEIKAPKETKAEEKKPESHPIKKEKQAEISSRIPPKIKSTKEITVKPRSGIGIFASYAMLSEKNYGSGLAFGVNFQLGITKNLAIELGGLKYQSNTERNPTGLSEGSLSLMPIQLSMQARFTVSNKIIPYIRGGVGYSMNNFTINSRLTSQWNSLGYDIKETVENSIEFHFGAGIDLLVHKNIALNGDIRYLISNTNGTWTFMNQIINTENTGNLNDLNLNTFIIGFGLKYFF
jgi:outer membrane protein W